MSGANFIERILHELGAQSLNRYRPLFMFIEALLVIIGALFFLFAGSVDSLFRASTWGAFSYTFPAEMWASITLTGALLTFFGLVHPPQGRMIASGIAIQFINYALTAYSAAFTGGDIAISLYAGFFASLHGWLGWLVVEDWRGEWKE